MYPETSNQIWMIPRHSTKPGITPMKNLAENGEKLSARKSMTRTSNVWQKTLNRHATQLQVHQKQVDIQN